MTATKIKMPRDLFKVPASNRIAKYAEMEAACRESLAQRIDLSYQMYMELEGEQGRIEQIQKRFEEAGEIIPAKRSLHDNISIFEVLRLPAPAGLGLSLKQTSAYAYARMRVLAQNKEWTLANRERAMSLLEEPQTSEPKMRQLIREETGKVVVDPRPVMRFRVPEKKVAVVEKALADVASELEKSGKPVPEDQGELLVNIIAEWRRLRNAAKKA